jgi:hypothetical protein
MRIVPDPIYSQVRLSSLTKQHTLNESDSSGQAGKPGWNA